MAKRIIILLFIMIMCLSFNSMVFAESNIEKDNEPLTLIEQDDTQDTVQANEEETREFTTSRKYSLQIGIVLLILIALYKAYKFVKYKNRR